MRGRIRGSIVLLLIAFVFVPAGTASAAQPPWCGTPEADASLALDGFPHIPYYAIGCTLRDISARSHGQMQVQTIGKSATGRDLYGVVINRLRTRDERKAFDNWLDVRDEALESPRKAQRTLDKVGDKIKIPIFVQGGIHGNEYEGVDAAINVIERFATTRPGTDPAVDRVLRHAILVFNPIQNPDGRVAGTRRNGNGFDLNRDYLTQSQSESAGVGRADETLAAAGGARSARLRLADADRGDDQAAQPEHRVRPVAEVEPAADRRQRGRGQRDRQERHAADQRLVRGRQHPGTRRAVPGRAAARARRGRELGRLGPVLHGDVRAASRPRLVHGRDVRPGPRRRRHAVRSRVRRPRRLA